MPSKATVGLCKKIGLPNYGSVGASCHVEFELDDSEPSQAPAVFEQRLRQVFAACSQAVQDELQRQQGASPEQPSAMTQGIPEQTTLSTPAAVLQATGYASTCNPAAKRTKSHPPRRNEYS